MNSESKANELISVIVPIYKVEKYLNRCVDSILSQTYKNIEIILVDDGSPDACGEICDRYIEKDNRIKVIHKKNGGLSAARNIGLDNASGKYIMFIDSDDYIHTEMIKKMYFSLLKEDADMCVCGMQWVNEDDSAYTDVLPSPIENCILQSNQKFDVFIKPSYFYFVTAVNKLYKKTLFEKNRFPLGKRNEDEFLAHHLFEKCEKIVCIQDKLYYYVQHNSSIMHSEFNVSFFDAVEAMLDRYHFFAKKKLIVHKKNAAYRAYNILYMLMQNIDVYKYRKKYLSYVMRVTGALGCNLRGVKLLLEYSRKTLRGAIKYNLIKFKLIKSKLLSKRARCVIIATPTHGNLGDQAIVYAERKLLHSLYPKRNILEIPNDDYLRFPELYKQYITKEDLIVIDGGGNLGSLWPREDRKITKIISDFSENKIRIFPQTCYYNLQEGEQLIQYNNSVYSNAGNLGVMLRDKKSYEIFSQLYPTVKSLFVPDIVLSLSPRSNVKRSGKVLLCFRDDLEKNICDEDRSRIEEFLGKSQIPFFYSSTIVTHGVTQKTRASILKEKWDEFFTSNLVITDRLHAMIFAAITGTPCIALDNISQKVSGAYEWIKDLEYISCVTDIEKVMENIPIMMDLKNSCYDFEYPTILIKEFLE